MRAYRQCRHCNAYTTIASGLHEWIQCEWMSFFSDCTIPCIWFNRSFRVLVHWHLSQATCAIAITSNQPTVHPFQRNNHYRFRFPQLDETIVLEKCPAEMTWRNERAKQSVSCHPSAPSRHIMSTKLERKKNAIDDCFHTLASQTLDLRLPPTVDPPDPPDLPGSFVSTIPFPFSFRLAFDFINSMRPQAHWSCSLDECEQSNF